MKSVLIFAILLVSLRPFAQQNISLTHSINDDGNTLSISIKGAANGKAIDYNRVFDVSSMSAAQKNVLTNRVYDSMTIKD